MATPDDVAAFEALMARSGSDLPPASWSGPGDLARMSIEAMAARDGVGREAASAGQVRLAGVGVTANTADLDDVGQVATLWQRCVTSVGAALEGFRAPSGRVPELLAARTRLRLDTAPAPGSIVLSVSPKSEAMEEVAPRGERAIFDEPRPLADRASEALIDLLASVSETGPDTEALGQRFQGLGPRASTSIKALAEVLDRAHFDLDVTWSEPDLPTRRAQIPAGTAGWLHDFVAGRALDGVEENLVGLVRTVSDVAKWHIEVGSDLVSIDASGLRGDDVRRIHVGQMVELHVFTRTTVRPDGTASVTRKAQGVLRVFEPDE